MNEHLCFSPQRHKGTKVHEENPSRIFVPLCLCGEKNTNHKDTITQRVWLNNGIWKVKEEYMNKSLALIYIHLCLLMILSCNTAPPAQIQASENISKPWPKVSGLPDLSGIEWISGNNFLAVHDAKYPSEKERPRVSILNKNNEADKITWKHPEIRWPEKTDLPSDLESIARIPGTKSFLLCESGNSGGRYTRIFHSVLDDENNITIKEVVDWPVKIYNVEASAVINIKDQNYFVYAERSHGKTITELKWAKLDLNPLRFGTFSAVNYSAGINGRGYRPIVALSASPDGDFYAVTAYDPNREEGPFRSYVSNIGQLRLTDKGVLVFIAANQFAKILEQEGNKIEGLTLVETKKKKQLFAGTDDEALGATFKKVEIQ